MKACVLCEWINRCIRMYEAQSMQRNNDACNVSDMYKVRCVCICRSEYTMRGMILNAKDMYKMQ